MSMEENNNPNPNPYDEYQDPEKDQSPPGGDGRKPGRTFLTILGIVGSIFVLAIIVLIAFVLISRNRTAARFQQQAATINAENTTVALIAAETASVLNQRMTEKAMPPTWTPTSGIVTATRTSTQVPPTRTSTVAVAADSAARTSTVAAFLTEVAQSTTAPKATGTRTTTVSAAGTRTNTVSAAGTRTTTVRATATRRTATTTALPTTGFAEDVGLPGLFGAALVLVVIIILARKLRLSTH